MASFPYLIVVVHAETECMYAIEKREENLMGFQNMKKKIACDKQIVPRIFLSNDTATDLAIGNSDAGLVMN